MAGTLLTYKSQSALKQFREKAPNVNLSLQMENCYAVREQVLSGQIDCGFHYDVGGYGDSVYIEKLKEYDLVLVCSPLLQDQDFVTTDQRKSTCLLTEDRNSIFLKRLEKYLEQKNIILGNCIELRSIEAIKRSVASNVGIAILPRFTVESELEQEILKEIEIPLEDNVVTAVCMYHKNKWMSPALNYFIKLMRESL